MSKIGLFFGTDTGTTRLVGKKIAAKLGDDLVAKPLNINRTSLEDMLSYSVMILGTATYGEGDLPGAENNVKSGSWAEFVPQLEGVDLSDKTIALYGVGNQEKYGDRYVNAMAKLYKIFTDRGAKVVGAWGTEGYTFSASEAVIDGQFVGLAIDNKSQKIATDSRIEAWTEMVKPELLAAI
ncbi:flavodoxin I [Alteromonadaceae bacterium 2753L.S.0a.02]|nr:flavodoxin I [Alteromonadaceae bacterium 2753L.S.0a.02]